MPSTSIGPKRFTSRSGTMGVRAVDDGRGRIGTARRAAWREAALDLQRMRRVLRVVECGADRRGRVGAGDKIDDVVLAVVRAAGRRGDERIAQAVRVGDAKRERGGFARDECLREGAGKQYGQLLKHGSSKSWRHSLYT